MAATWDAIQVEGRGTAMSKAPSAEFLGGSGRIRLEGRVRAGHLDIECQEFAAGHDKFTVVRGRVGDQPIYRAKFS